MPLRQASEAARQYHPWRRRYSHGPRAGWQSPSCLRSRRWPRFCTRPCWRIVEQDGQGHRVPARRQSIRQGLSVAAELLYVRGQIQIGFSVLLTIKHSHTRTKDRTVFGRISICGDPDGGLSPQCHILSITLGKMKISTSTVAAGR